MRWKTFIIIIWREERVFVEGDKAYFLDLPWGFQKNEESRIFWSWLDSLVVNDKWQTALITLFRRVPLREAFSNVAPHIVLQQQQQQQHRRWEEEDERKGRQKKRVFDVRRGGKVIETWKMEKSKVFFSPFFSSLLCSVLCPFFVIAAKDEKFLCHKTAATCQYNAKKCGSS